MVYHSAMPSSTAAPAPQGDDDQLDRVFRALADRTRRAILRRLSTGSATITELAAPFGMSLPGVSKHLTVLEHAGLVGYRSFWESALDSLADYVATER